MASKDRGKSSSAVTECKVDFSEPLKINNWNTTALKNALDDTVKKIAKEEYGFVENFCLMDTRLAICTIACMFSGFAMAYDYFYPFPASKVVLATCSICYFLMTGVLTLFTMYKEKNIFMVGMEKDEAGVGPAKVWTFQSTLPRFSDTYTLQITCKDGQTQLSRSSEIEKSVSNWFTEEGELVSMKFFKEIKNIYLNVSQSKKDE